MDYELKNDDSFVDFDTAHYYSTKAAALAEKYATASPGYTRYYRNKPDKQLKLLDIGCGSGRDLAEFQEAGFEITGVDVSKEMLTQAELKYPQVSGKLINSGLPALSGVTGKFDIILCSGVIQHIQTQYLYESFRTISSLLNDEGIFIFSFPIDYPGINPATMRDKNNRLFIIRPEEKYKFLIERHGLKNIEREKHEDSHNRRGISWAVHVYRKREGFFYFTH
jgi:2-polyprenyl-3-methyl-5-hydroxy-6-metoxy-1,4-benzoquinol methylase